MVLARSGSSQNSLHSSCGAVDAQQQQLQQTDWRSIYLITFICVMDAMRISAVLTNSWPYVSSVDPELNEEFFGLSKSAFTLGAIVASVLSGWLSNRISHTKPPIFAGLIMSALACIFFANLELIPRNRRYGFLIAEILFGVGMGAIQTWRVCIAMSSTDADRSKATSLIGFAMNLGFVLGPLVVLSIGRLLRDRVILLPWGTHLNIFTAPIYLMTLLSLCGALLLFLCFDGRMRRFPNEKKGRRTDEQKWARGMQDQLEKAPLDVAISTDGAIPPPPAASEDPPYPTIESSTASSSNGPEWIAILACFVARFCFMAFILYLMALAAPYTMSVFGWNGEQMVFYQMLAQGTMGCMGILVCLGYTLRLLSRFKERFCVLAALTLMFTFFLATFPWPFLTAELPEPVHSVELSVNGTMTEKLISHGCDRAKYDWCQRVPAINVIVYHVALILCLGLAMPVGQLNLDVLYSRLLGPIKQGTMQGLFVAVGDMVSLCGPLIITAVYQKAGPRPVWIGEIILFGLGISFWIFCYPKLKPNSGGGRYEPVMQAETPSAVEEEADTEWTNLKRRQANGMSHKEPMALA